jgi:hypothetical protein
VVALLTAVRAARRSPGAWIDAPKDMRDDALTLAVSRLHTALRPALPPSARVVDHRRNEIRLSARVRVSEIAWQALATGHGDERVRKLAASALRKH